MHEEQGTHALHVNEPRSQLAASWHCPGTQAAGVRGSRDGVLAPQGTEPLFSSREGCGCSATPVVAGDLSREGRANSRGAQQWWRPDGGPQPPAHSKRTRNVEQQAHPGFPLLLPRSQLIAGARDSCRELLPGLGRCWLSFPAGKSPTSQPSQGPCHGTAAGFISQASGASSQLLDFFQCQGTSSLVPLCPRAAVERRFQDGTPFALPHLLPRSMWHHLPMSCTDACGGRADVGLVFPQDTAM